MLDARGSFHPRRLYPPNKFHPESNIIIEVTIRIIAPGLVVIPRIAAEHPVQVQSVGVGKGQSGRVREGNNEKKKPVRSAK